MDLGYKTSLLDFSYTLAGMFWSKKLSGILQCILRRVTRDFKRYSCYICTTEVIPEAAIHQKARVEANCSNFLLLSVSNLLPKAYYTKNLSPFLSHFRLQTLKQV